MAVRRTGLALSIVVAVAAFLVWHFFMTPLKTPTFPTTLPTRHLSVGTESLVVEVASSESEREEGLSGRKGLSEGTGMLFVFEHPGLYGFWMKDMVFSLDIIFADEEGKVVTVSPNVSPQSYPEIFAPAKPAVYVLEVPAGYASAHGIAVGAQFVLQQ